MNHTFAYLSGGGFLGLPIASDPAAAAGKRFAVAGVNWDGSVTNRPGARLGPSAIRQTSRMLCDATHPLFDVSALDLIADLGDLLLPNTSLEAMRTALMPQAAELIGRHEMVWLGGDHSITLPLLRAYRRHYGRPLACIHFDAHCDTWTDHFGEPSGHGTWVYEAFTEGLVVPEAFVQVGIRSSGVREAREFVDDRGGRIYTARELRGKDGAGLQYVIDEVKARLAKAGNPPVYLTFDIDALDPAYAPGTGTPEPGGLTSAQAMTLLEGLYDLDWVGMDCTEVAPPYDHAELTSNAAATLVWTWLCGRMAAQART
jgi:agmatinase